MARKTSSKVGSATERDQRLAAIERDARFVVSGGSRGVVGSGDAGGKAVGDPIPGAHLGKSPDAGKTPVDPVQVAAAALRASVVDALHGYHEFGFALTGHEHWREIKDAQRDRAADPFARVIGSLPPEQMASVLNTLAYASVVLVGFEMLAVPVVASVKIKREEKKKKSEVEKKPTAGEKEDGPNK